MSAASLTFDIIGRDKASQAFKNVGQQTDALHAKFGRLASAATTLAKGALLGAVGGAVVGIGAVLKTGVGEVEDYQKGFAQLTQGLKTTHGAAGITAKQMETLASRIQDYSGQTDDSIVATEQLLLTFTNIRNEAGKNNDVFTQTTKIAADMAARMGGDASTQAIRLGKALNDPVKGVSALARVGVSFTEGQKKSIAAMVKHGHTLKAQKVILAELTKEFGGSAKAVGNTLPGMIDKAKRHFEDWSQSMVTKLLPVLREWLPKAQQAVSQAFQYLSTNVMPTVISVIRAVVPRLVDLGHWIQKNAEWLKPLAAAIATAVAVAWTIVKVTRAWKEAQLLLNLALDANPIGIVITALAALAVGLIYAYKHSDKFRHIVQAAFGAVSSAVKTLVAIWRAEFRIAASVIQGIASTASRVVSDIRGAFDRLVGFFTGMPARISRVTSGMWDGIKEAFRAAVDFIIDGWNSLQFTMPSINTHLPGVGKVGGFTVGTPDIPRLAAGGIIPATPGGRLVLAGEAGRAEAVKPLGPGGMTAGERAIVAAIQALPIVRLGDGGDVERLRRSGR